MYHPFDGDNGEIVKRAVAVRSVEEVRSLFGNLDENIQVFRDELGVDARTVDDNVVLSGPASKVAVAVEALERLLELLRAKEPVDRSRIRYAINLAQEGNAHLIGEIMGGVVAVTYRGKQIKTRTLGQKAYVDALKRSPVVLSIGPAGTGKTYLAMAMAVVALKNREVARIVLTRPAVEAGEKLGFLPGDLQQKVDPYLRPLQDAMFDIMGNESYARLQEKGVVEVAPLAYMRGRTLNDSFIILDEGQNTTREQMKMFLTRMGTGSRMVITGDITQIDLPEGKRSGLVEAMDVLGGVEGVEVIRLTHRDVVRHEIVQRIIQAYDKFDRKKAEKR